MIVLLLIGSIVLIISSSRCPKKRQLVWYEKNLIYEIDVKRFRDVNGDGIGDIEGIEEKIKYFQENRIKSLLFRSTMFNESLHEIDPSLGNDQQMKNLVKTLHRKGLLK